MPRHLAPLRRTVFVSAVVVMAASRSAFAVSSCAEICGAGTGACTINKTFVVAPDSELDCSGRNLTLTGAGVLKVTGGEMSLLANNLTVNGPGGSILGLEASDATPATISIGLTGNLVLAGKIRANGQSGGGTIEVFVEGNVTIPESGTDGIEADGTGPGADGGDISIEANGTISIFDPIHAAGAGSQPSAGGSIEIRAQGAIVTSADGHVSAEGLSGGGGRISIISDAGSVTLGEHLDVEGRGTAADGGDIDVFGAAGVSVTQDITARGGVNVSGASSLGGSVTLRSGCGGLSVQAVIVANGGTLTDSASGAIHLESDGTVSINSGATLDVRALDATGDGGTINVVSGTSVNLATNSLLDARGGGTTPGHGGTVNIVGCTAEIDSGSTIRVSAYRGGKVSVAARAPVPQAGDAPLHIQAGAVVQVVGSTSSLNGVAELRALHRQQGACSNQSSKACDLNSECSVGCETGVCTAANPNTDGVGSQFDLTPVRSAASELGICAGVCP